jgi:hypothetical protein
MKMNWQGTWSSFGIMDVEQAILWRTRALQLKSRFSSRMNAS